MTDYTLTCTDEGTVTWTENGGWQPIETAPEWETVLTQHEDDLYPVPAYKVPDSALNVDHWLRETEGPEDSFYGGGRHERLYRRPTHWQPLPPRPRRTET